MACDQSEFVFCEGELDVPDVRALLELHFARMRAGSPPEACHVLPIDGLRDPAVRLVSIRNPSGRLLGVGALKRIEPGHGELKSMRTHDDVPSRLAVTPVASASNDQSGWRWSQVRSGFPRAPSTRSSIRHPSAVRSTVRRWSARRSW